MNKLALFALYTLLNNVVNAQDFHYWSDQFGMKSSALGGAVTSGIDDHSMVYYNAAALFSIKNPSLSFSINAYQYSTFEQKNAMGKDQNVHSTEFATLPNLMAGVLSPKKYNKIRFGYTVLSTNNYNNKLNLLHRADYDCVAGTAGTEHFIGTYQQHFTNSEYWAGLAIAYQFNPFLSIGLTHLGIYKSTTYSNLMEFTAQPQDPSTGEVSQWRSDITFNYYNIKGIFKPALQLNFPKFKLGIAYTTPSFNIYGRGNFYREMNILNLNEVLASDVSWIENVRKVKTVHKTMGSLAVGLTFQAIKGLDIYISAETFFKQPYYLIYNSTTSPSTYPNYFSDSMTYVLFGNQNFLSYGEAYKPVTNIAIGFDLSIDTNLSIQCGARTDYNYNQFQNYTMELQTIESTKYDRLIMSIGSRYSFKNGREFSLCFELGFALPKTYYVTYDFTTPDETRNGLIGDPGTPSITKAYTYRLMLGLKLGKN